jgi:2',3'-cyclic-nucleotide 2'-phosphodiesterase (5'-nucleotidase family)
MNLLLRFGRLMVMSLVVLLLGCYRDLTIQQTETQQYIFSHGVQPVESNLDAFIKPYRDSLSTKVNRVIAFADADLTIGRAGRDLYPSQVAMGNFMVDACFEVARKKAVALSQPQPDLSIFTWGSIRKSLPAGNITILNMYETMPFENEMVVLKLNGKQTLTLLNQLAVDFNPIGGATIFKGESNRILINGNPIEQDKFYYVLASDYLSFGGDNLSILTEASDRYWCGIKVRDALIAYLESLTANGTTIKPTYEQRIRN